MVQLPFFFHFGMATIQRWCLFPWRYQGKHVWLLPRQWRIQKGGFSHWHAKYTRKFWGCHAQFRSLPLASANSRKSKLNISKATLDLVKHLEIGKELIHECVTVPGCCCCMPLLHNHLMDLCSYVRKSTLLATKGGCICTPITPLNPPLQELCSTNNKIAASLIILPTQPTWCMVIEAT